MCGVLGVVSNQPVNQDLYDGLSLLQHRGQDAAGIVTVDEEGRFSLRKDVGLVNEVIRTRHMRQLKGNMGIGHVRYPTSSGATNPAEAQPFYVNSPFGIALAHNGNLTNADILRQDLIQKQHRHLNTYSDSEILLNILADSLHAQVGHTTALTAMQIFAAVKSLNERVKGAYAVVAVIAGHGLLAFRDPHAIRPLCFGRRQTEEGAAYMFASESIALDGTGFELLRDLAPGEAIYIDESGQVYSAICAEDTSYTPCMFEFVYFARPDSIMDGISIHKARQEMGRHLAENIQKNWPDHDIDVIIPIPDTSRTSALKMAQILGVEYSEGLIRNRYIARTFIMAGQQQRRQSVRKKLNAIREEFQGKNVLLVDDSIVRGTTSKEIVRMAREAGAKKVYMASAAPPVIYPNVYGIDMPNQADFIAYRKSAQQVAEIITCDYLIYQNLSDLNSAILGLQPTFDRLDNSCFDGQYVTGDVDIARLETLAMQRVIQQKHVDDNAISGHDESQLSLHNQL